MKTQNQIIESKLEYTNEVNAKNNIYYYYFSHKAKSLSVNNLSITSSVSHYHLGFLKIAPILTLTDKLQNKFLNICKLHILKNVFIYWLNNYNVYGYKQQKLKILVKRRILEVLTSILSLVTLQYFEIIWMPSL